MHNSSTAVLNLIENHRIYPFYGQKCTQMCTLVCTIGTHTGNKPVVAIFKIEQNIFQTKIDACLWFLVCGLQSGGWYTLQPRSVPIPIDEASISLIFRKIPVMVRCIVAGLERGEGFAQLWNFSNFLGKFRPPMHVNPKIKLRKRRTAVL